MATDVAPPNDLAAVIDQMMHPYRGALPEFPRLPAEGLNRQDVLGTMEDLQQREADRWESGLASGAVYNGDRGHIDFVSRVYTLHSQVNPLHTDLWPSAAKFEAEIVSMTAHMLNGDKADAPVGSEEGICGSVSSGGSESILLAMKTYRDWAKATKGINEPELVVPVSAHAAFHKAAQYFGLKLRVIPLDDEFCVDIPAMKAAVNKNTIALVGSACNFPYGTIDSIERLSEIAVEKGVGLHVDGCLGGFFLPWAEKLGQPVPPFDFRLPGVTSMSCDTHKYGYAPKGTSVVLYRGQALRRFQYFTTSDWPGGLYYSPTFSGSRPGGLSAACWAALVSIGEQGYLEATRQILAAVATMKRGVTEIPGLRLIGRTIGVFAFLSTDEQLNMYQVLDRMSEKGWALTGLQRPAGIHISPTLRHAQPGVAERFVSDLKEAVALVRENPDFMGGMAPIYGLAATVPDRSLVHGMLQQVMDVYYRV
ncbi:MAG TPA: aminotransferase class V-fold PLP-dependent enzyme [Planctomycetaceae bacterium]|jgi:glutamate/tyrosine decarboxylase-like PLP-dependent enzyme|nr:aminotransferase class V-fold PLP-dependent enzyme [Planctomycetaceae bacterium]